MILLRFLLYGISDLLFLGLYYIVRYRKEMVMQNLRLAFPDYTPKKHRQIMRKFYHNLTDLFAEMIIMSMASSQQIQKMIKRNFHVLEPSIKEKKNIIFLSGHIINWELMGLIFSIPPIYKNNLGFYLPIKNKIFDSFIYKMRTKHGGILINVYKLAREVLKYKGDKLTFGFLADQRPFFPQKSYWVDFFSIKTPFIKEPEKCAKIFDADVYFFALKKVKRGVYEAHGDKINFDQNKEGDLIEQFAYKLQQAITAYPDLYLWSHNRWKFRQD